MVNAKQIKENLGVRAKDIIINELNLKFSKGKCNCPLHDDKKPSMSWFQEGLMFKCHACNGTIDIYSFYTDFQKLSFVEAVENVARLTGDNITETNNVVKKSEFTIPDISLNDLSEQSIELMSKRKINKETLDAWKVKETIWNFKVVYAFQYFNEKNDLEFISFREAVRCGFKGGCLKNTKQILWGMNNVDVNKPLIITEGQPDAMAVWQSGYKNVVSVPSGANNFAWITNCWDWLQTVKEFIVFADNDKAGLKFANEIKRRLNNVKVLVADRKDANEVLYYDGENKLLKLVQDEINRMPEGLIDVSYLDYKSVLETRFKGIETGFYDYDSHVEDWKEEELTILVGRNGEGKTTFISQVIANCIENKVKTFLYSGEMSDNKIQNWLYRQMVGNKSEYTYKVETKYATKTEIRPEIVKKIKEWHNETLYLFDRQATDISDDTDKFFELMELSSKKYGIKLFIIDNLMSKLQENANSINSDQSNFVQKCKDFTIRNKCHLVLVVHPNKIKSELKEGESANIEKTDISGSNNIANKSDNIISIERNWSTDRDFDAVITSLKDRESGERKSIKYLFSKESLRFYNPNTKKHIVYGWMAESKEDQKHKQIEIDGIEQCPF